MGKFKNNYLCYFLVFLFLQFMFSSFKCKKGLGGLDLRMYAKNKSSNDIYYIFSTEYPDINIPGYPPQPDPTKDPATTKIQPNSSQPIYLRDSWEHVVSQIPEGKLVFFFFDANVLESTKWDTVRKYNMYLSRKILTLDSIKKMNWTVSYP